MEPELSALEGLRTPSFSHWVNNGRLDGNATMSSGRAGNPHLIGKLVEMVHLFRDTLDLPPCKQSVSLDEVSDRQEFVLLSRHLE